MLWNRNCLIPSFLARKVKTTSHSHSLILTISKWSDYATVAGIRLTKEPCIITMEDDPLKPRGVMSCGHAVLPSALTQYAVYEVQKGASEFVCPYVDLYNPNIKCEAKWYLSFVSFSTYNSLLDLK